MSEMLSRSHGISSAEDNMDIDNFDWTVLSDSNASEALSGGQSMTGGHVEVPEFDRRISTVTSSPDLINNMVQSDVQQRRDSKSLTQRISKVTLSSMYDPERRIRADSPRSPPKRVHRAVWRSLIVQIMKL